MIGTHDGSNPPTLHNRRNNSLNPSMNKGLKAKSRLFEDPRRQAIMKVREAVDKNLSKDSLGGTSKQSVSALVSPPNASFMLPAYQN